MITVTRFDHSEFILNADLIEFIEARPDTHITLVTGKKLLVRESTEEVVTRVVEFRRRAGIFPRPPMSAVHVGDELRSDWAAEDFLSTQSK
jgi:flagellar protein FlbD